MDGMMPWAAIGLGGAFGAVARSLLARLASIPPGRPARPLDPALATLAANLAACALLGGVTAAVDASIGLVPEATARTLMAFAASGVGGALSTFSTLCGDAVRLLRNGPRGQALVYLLAHLVGGPLALACGSWLAS